MTLAQPAPAPTGFKVAAVEAWLLRQLPQMQAPLRWTRLEGGHSNLTCLIEDARGQRLVVRRPPEGELLPKAHDMAREWALISALGATAVPVPQALAFCDDPAITGAPFYAMGHVAGRPLIDADEVRRWLPEAGRVTLGEHFIDVLADLHALDPEQIGLGALGRHDGYIERQLKTWYRSWQASMAAARLDDPRAHELQRYFLAHLPDQGPARLVHGDYGLHNTLVADDGRIAAVVDWEISTLGDPLADLAYALNQWAQPGDAPSARQRPATQLPGFAPRQVLAERYAERTGRDLSRLDYHVGFNRWKSAAIGHGVHARYLLGQKSSQGIDLAAMRRGILQSLDLAEAAVNRLEQRARADLPRPAAVTVNPGPMNRAQAVLAASAPGQPLELVDAVVAGRSLRVFRHAPPSLRALFEATASDLPFLSYEAERYSFAQSWAAASRIGQVLVRQCGVRPGDRVAISMRNLPEWLVAFNAITAVGAVAVAMNAHWQADEMVYGLVDSGARVLLADADRLQRWHQAEQQSQQDHGHAAVPGLQVLAVRCEQPLPPGVQSLAALTEALGDASVAVAMPPATIAPDDLATMLYTSGSTGHPKGVPSSHRNIVSALLSWELDVAVAALVAGQPAPTPAAQAGTLLAVPLFHVSGLHASCLMSYRTQRRLAMMGRWSAQAAAALIDELELSSMNAPAAMTGDLLRVAQAGGHDLSSLLQVGGGGAPRASEQVRQLRASFANAMPATGWGMTETNAIGTGVGGEDYLRHPASSGRCSQVLQLRIVDEAGQTLPGDQRGELLVRGTSVFAGYWNRPDANAQAFVDGDWFRTGDVATINDEGFVFIVDRIKDLIIRGGENIGCGQVEAALLQHPDVFEATVYAVPDARLGEEVGATVYGLPSLDLQALRAFLGQHLARFELPRYFLRSDQPLPRTPSGKILKREIRQAALLALQEGQGRDMGGSGGGGG